MPDKKLPRNAIIINGEIFVLRETPSGESDCEKCALSDICMDEPGIILCNLIYSTPDYKHFEKL